MLEKISLEVGCFGKLPLSPEFIRVNAKGSVLSVFDQWLQEGLYGYRGSLGSHWMQDYLQSDTWNFIFHEPGGTECLVGVVTPNQDKAGRGFPMAIFLRMEVREFSGKIHKIPVYFQPFLDWGKHMVEEGWKTHSLQEFRERVSGWEPSEAGNWDSLDRLYHEFLGAYTLDGLLQLCEARKSLVSVASVKVRVQEMVSSHRPSNMSKAGQLMPFPLIHDPAIPFEIPFWMEYLDKISNFTMDCPILFWSKCPHKSPAVVFMQEAPVSPKSFAKLIHPRKFVEPHWYLSPESSAGEKETEGADDHFQIQEEEAWGQEDSETLDRLLR